MKIDCSVGEVVDKISILDIKIDSIKDPIKLGHCMIERDVLLEALKDNELCTEKVDYYRKTLRAVNQVIWDDQEVLRVTTDWAEYGKLAYRVILYNDARFRLKRILNEICVLKNEVQLKEQKSYQSKSFHIILSSKLNFKEQVAQTRYLSSMYDHITVLDGADRLKDALQDHPFVSFCTEKEYTYNDCVITVQECEVEVDQWFFDGSKQ